MVTSLRLFIALWPTPATRAAVVAALAPWCWPDGARRVAAPDLHLTLAFLGAVPAQQLGQVTRAADMPSAKVELVLDRLEIWQGGIVVLRPSTVPDNLADLHDRLTQALRATGLPFDARPFAPHVTLARKARGAGERAWPALRWRSTGHVLARSAGGRYSVVARFG